MKIEENIVKILKESKIEENILYLPNTQLDRKTYESVNKVIEMLGGKWNRKAKGHVFEVDPTEKINSVINTETATNWKKDLQFFPTPRNIAEHMCSLAEIMPESFVLEPSCGRGDLADVIWEKNPAMLFGIDINPDMEVHLKNKPYDTATGVDFLEEDIQGYWDRIIMNPPFNCGKNGKDFDHIMKAYEILAPGGILISIVSEASCIHIDNKSKAFQQFLKDHNAYVEKIDPGAFKESGTLVATRLIKINKSVDS